MVFDMAHLVRRALEHLGLPARCVCGMLTHSTSRVPERKTLAIADAYAWLREWKYWQTNKRQLARWRQLLANGAATDNAPPLSQAYLVHLGDEIGEQEFEQAADDVAAYLYLDVATAGGEFFDKCRQPCRFVGPIAGAGGSAKNLGNMSSSFLRLTKRPSAA